jgi:hypothetical protein
MELFAVQTIEQVEFFYEDQEQTEKDEEDNCITPFNQNNPIFLPIHQSRRLMFI